MTRIARTLIGLMTLALVAGAVTASAAEAAPKFTPSQYPATLKGEGASAEPFVVTFGAPRNMKCSWTPFEGSVASKTEAESSSIRITPWFLTCSAEVLGNFVLPVVQMNGCYFSYSLEEAATGAPKEAGWEYTGGLEFKCPEGVGLGFTFYENMKKYEEGTPLCAYAVAPQGPLKSIDYKLEKSGAVLHAKTEATSIAATRTFGTLTNCGKPEPTLTLSTDIAFELLNSKAEHITGSFDAM